jgi:tRNA modification GTPase
VVLVGAPNVGKSSLMNALSGSDVSIVTPIPGTTRDAIAREIEIDGIPLTVIDTAGLRPSDDPIETLGIERTWTAVRRADLALVLVDARAEGDGLGPATDAILAQLPAALPRIVVHNKIDLCADDSARVARDDSADETPAHPRCHVSLSAKTGAGVDALRREVLALAGAQEAMEGTFLARERHLHALRDATTHLDGAAGQLAQEAPPLELLAEELREAQTALAAITGEFTADDLLGVIFSRFCIGK